MNITQAAQILAYYGSFQRGRGQTGYGEVYECACCCHAMNAGDRKHAADCRLVEALKVAREAETAEIIEVEE